MTSFEVFSYTKENNYRPAPIILYVHILCILSNPSCMSVPDDMDVCTEFCF